MDRCILLLKAVLYVLAGKSDERYLHIKSELVRLVARAGLYEPKIYAQVPRLLQSGAVAIDIGANCGVYTRRFLECVGPLGTVLAFEPNPFFLDSLQRLQVQGRSAVVRGEAVSDTAGQSNLRIPRIQWGAPEPALASLESGASVDSRLVRQVRLDDALHELTRVDLIKIDVEGGEINALQGSVRLITRFRPILIIETLEKARLQSFFRNAALPYRYHGDAFPVEIGAATSRRDATYVLTWCDE